VLNRLCAIRMAEARGIVIESIGNGYNSKGFQLYARLAGTSLGETGAAYRCYLFSLFDEFAVDLAVLFDRYSPMGRLFPKETVLNELINKINHPDIESLWAQDETIGWVYQYFNSKEERKKMRDESQAPRNSRELAVRNQFFTPRYVVEFLTDNTLGRIWYEMTQGRTSLKDKCRYMVRRPNEIFLKQGEDTPEQETQSENLSQEELLKQTVYIPFRPLKDPRGILMLDPACGSMHFGLYAYDLFEVIYKEAWQNPVLGASLWKELGWLSPDEISDARRIAQPETVCLKRDAEIKSFFSGRELSTEDAVVVIADMYGTAWPSGRPLIYHKDEVESKKEQIAKTIPLNEFNYAKAINDGLISPDTGLTFLELAGCFEYKTIETNKADMFEKLSAASREESLSILRRELPRLIIENNIHGIDIDPRAVQIAGLSLWLRAQRSWKDNNIKPAERPKIRKSNIVCAEPMPGEEDMLQEFTAGLKPRVLGQIVEIIFEKMNLAGEAGSLLKIEEEIEGAVERAREEFNKELLRRKQDEGYLPGMAPVRPVTVFDFADLPDKTRFWEDAVQKILDALKQYAENAESSDAEKRKMFADDAAKGFAFIELSRKRYDVVLMNPPFGEASATVLEYIQDRYPTWNQNLLCSFLEMGWLINTTNGFTAAIFDRTAIVKSTYEDFRRKILIPDDRISTEADLGWEVLDANVEVTTCVLSNISVKAGGLFFDIRTVPSNKKGGLLYEMVKSSQCGIFREDTVIELSSRFANLPNAVIGYDFPLFLRRVFVSFPSLENVGFKAYQGHALKADKHFRLWWELNSRDQQTYISRMFNGAGFSPFVTSLLDCVVSPVKLEKLPKDTATVLRNIDKHCKPGICFGKRGEYFCVHILPPGHVFTVEGQSIPITDQNSSLDLVAYLNTSLIRFALNKYCGQHKYSGYVNLLPYSQIKRDNESRTMILESIKSIQSAQQRDEIQSCFWTLPATQNIRNLGEILSDIIRKAWSKSEECEVFFNSELETLFGVIPKESNLIQCFREGQPKREPAIEDADVSDSCLSYSAHSVLSYSVGCMTARWDIRYATGEKQPPELPDPFVSLPVCPPGMLQNEQGLPLTKEDAKRLKGSGKWNYPIEIPWDGIIVDDPGHNLDIEARLRQVLEIIWKDRAESIEHEACEILGFKSLRDYFSKPAGFFADHLKRYSKSRRQAPIYWPLSTASGSYTLWVYYHRLTDQTLYKCVNDFVEPKLKLLADAIGILSSKPSRSRQEEKELENLAELELELKDFREELLRIAKFWNPNLNDGVQITAAPLWKLFKFPKWQKTLKETWQKLEKGEYDWAHLAYSIWPERVIKKSHKDRSLVIAHDLENELWEEVIESYDKQGNPKTKWKPKKLSDDEMRHLIKSKTG
jgi:hypothetical protein